MSEKVEATRLLVDHLKPGMICAADVVGLYGDLVVKAETHLTDPIIQRIKISGAKAVYIVISSMKERQTQRVFYDIEKKQEKMVESFNTIFEEGVIDQTGIVGIVTDAIAVASNTGGVTKYLDLLHQKTEYTYTHCMSVSMLARLFAEWLKLSSEEVYDITLAGSLHDIGKLEVGLDLINKPDKLSDEEYTRMKEHVLRGGILLKPCDIPVRVLRAIVEHHERLDGKGYPFNRVEADISKHGKMMAIVDVYDALVSKRSYRDALCPFFALEIIEKDRGIAFDDALLDVFMKRIVFAYLNTTVQLSNTELAEIVAINPNVPLRPILKTEKGETVDLAKEPQLKIVKVWQH